MAVMLHAINVLRATGAVVPVEDYQAVCAERDVALAEVAWLASLVRERTPETVTSGDLTIDLRTRELLRDGEPFGRLSRVQCTLIRRLAMEQGTAVPYAAIDAYVWGTAARYDNDGHRVRVNVCRLRTKLGRSANRVVVHPGFGVALR